jgi:hypothetical protein
MEKFTLKVDNQPSIRFTGSLIGSAENSDDRATGRSFSGETGRWTELALYKTKGGKFVCHQIGRTRWAREHDRYTAEICDTLDEVREFFGHRWLAKELYDDAGIDDITELD